MKKWIAPFLVLALAVLLIVCGKGITEKEFEIIKLAADGLSNKEIASRLYLGEGTVRNYFSSILDKLGLRDRTQLVVYYYKD